MKILVLGGKGMAGHVITQYLKENTNWDICYTSRDKKDEGGIYLDVLHQTRLEEIIDGIQPDIVINAIGILNEKADEHESIAFQVNSLLPHQVAKLAERYGGKLIHISTDCVFSGEKGNYTETDERDGTTNYAKTKALGEVIDDRHLTIRTSIIGPELKNDGIGLYDWFMKQKGDIQGYRKAMWNGVTTIQLAKAIHAMILNNVTGLYHLCADEKISKYELLKLFQKTFQKYDVIIHPEDQIDIDRTIVNTREDFTFSVPSYKMMVEEMKEWMERHG